MIHTCLRVNWNLTIMTLIVGSVLLAACSRSNADKNIDFSYTATPSINETVPQAKTTSTPTPETTVALSPSPTARVFIRANDCRSPSDDGHIFFLNPYGATEDSFAYNLSLFVMSGNGCFPRLVMSNVSGSPAWSKDWRYIAIGCKRNTYLCILDVKATLDTCKIFGVLQAGHCDSIVTREFALPAAISGQTFLCYISWSSDSSRIVIDGRYSAYILHLDDGDWIDLRPNQWPYAMPVDWSPTEDVLIISGLDLIDPSNDDNLNTKLPAGINPQWSPDGTEIAFLRSSDDRNKEPWGIAVTNPANGKWNWLYEPRNWDNYHWPPQNIYLGSSDGFHRVLSWSPDGQYIAFSSVSGNEVSLFRLDLESKEIVSLTKDLNLVDGEYIAPAWGP